MTALTDELIDGVTIKIGRTVRVVPALSLKQLRLLKPKLELLSNIKQGDEVTDELSEAMLHIVHTALKRNYPNMSLDELENDFDLSNRDRIIKAVMGVSGLVPSGEVKPAT